MITVLGLYLKVKTMIGLYLRAKTVVSFILKLKSWLVITVLVTNYGFRILKKKKTTALGYFKKFKIIVTNYGF